MPAPTGVVFDQRYTAHDTGHGHPERPERITVLAGAVDAQPNIRRIEPRPARLDEIALVHDGAYVDQVARTRGRERYAFDADTPVSAKSFDTALLAAGGLLELIDHVMTGELANGFALVRPPGHHAESRRAMGFCLFNNVAVGAEYLRQRHGLKRVLVVDWDVHHGNGTQHMFERDPGVMYVSTHQYPYYPGTGALDETGIDEGEGFTVNIPLPEGCGDSEYVEAFRTVIEPIAHQYDPEFVLISAGFDPHVRDPLAGMNVTEAGFAAMARSLVRVANGTANGRCVAVLEGGYDLRAIRDGASVVLAELQQREPSEATFPPGHVEALFAAIRKIQRRYWRF